MLFCPTPLYHTVHPCQRSFVHTYNYMHNQTSPIPHLKVTVVLRSPPRGRSRGGGGCPGGPNPPPPPPPFFAYLQYKFLPSGWTPPPPPPPYLKIPESAPAYPKVPCKYFASSVAPLCTQLVDPNVMEPPFSEPPLPHVYCSLLV